MRDFGLRGVSPIWILPLLALAIGLWLVYRSFADAGVMAVIVFSDARGIEPGRTQVIYRGLPVGQVKAVEIAPDFQSVRASVEFDRIAAGQLKRNTRFWMVRARVSAGEVSGLETLVKGNHVGMLPGDGEDAREFVAVTEPPVAAGRDGGLKIRLIADSFDSLQPGSKVFHKGLEAGEVLDSTLDENGKVSINAVIKPGFAARVSTGARFYNVGGISLSADLSGVALHAAPLASILAGGVSFFVPDGDARGEPAAEGAVFTLYPDRERALNDGPLLTLQLDSAHGLREKSPIRYKGIDIGSIESLRPGADGNSVQAQARIRARYAADIGEHSRFWLVEPKLGLMETRNLGTLITGRYVAVDPISGNPGKHFRVALEPPRPAGRGPLKILLKADRAGSIKAGNRLFFRGVAVGEVAALHLATDAGSVLLETLVEDQYAPLVRDDSVFWRISGVSVDLGLFSGAKVQTGSLQTIMEGGIAFATPGAPSATADGEMSVQTLIGDIAVASADDAAPTHASPGARAKPGAEFPLLDEAPDDWEKWRPGIHLD